MVGLPVQAGKQLLGLTLAVPRAAAREVPALLQAALRVDPVALIGSLADLPQVLGALPGVLERVGELVVAIEGVVGEVAVAVAGTVGTVDALVVEVAGIPPRVERLISSIEAVPPRVETVLGTVESIPPRVTRLVGEVEAIPRRVEAIMGSVEGTIAAVGPVLAGADKAVAAGRRTVIRADSLVESIASPVDTLVPVLTLLGGLEVELLGRLGQLVAGLEPLLDLLASVEPDAAAGVAQDASDLVAVLPQLLQRVETEVLPAVHALEGLVPAVEGLTHDVERLGAIVNGLPGAGRLMRRGDERTKP